MRHTASNHFQLILTVNCAPVLAAVGDGPPAHPNIDGRSECRRVQDAVEKIKDHRTGRGVPFKLVHLRPPTLANLRATLQTGRVHPAYAMVHLIGCVPADGLLRMEKENGREEKVSPG